MPEPNKSSIKRRLSDTQLIALSSASQREDGAVTLPDRIKGAAAANLISSLVAKGLVCETPAVGGMPVARRDEEGRLFALVITGLGRASINAAEEASANRNQEDEVAETQIGAPSAEQPQASDVSEPLQHVALLPAATVAKPDSAPLEASPWQTGCKRRGSGSNASDRHAARWQQTGQRHRLAGSPRGGELG